MFNTRQQLSLKQRSIPAAKVYRKKGCNIAYYAVDVRDRVIRRVTREYNGVDNARYVLIEAGSAKQAWAKASRSSAAIGGTQCEQCRHRHCSVCEECSVAKQYSDYWICHCCGILNLRLPNLP
ncbi:MAG: hypothetical protein ACREQV_14290 [Candidatus Binatia bacterium]